MSRHDMTCYAMIHKIRPQAHHTHTKYKFLPSFLHFVVHINTITKSIIKLTIIKRRFEKKTYFNGFLFLVRFDTLSTCKGTCITHLFFRSALRITIIVNVHALYYIDTIRIINQRYFLKRHRKFCVTVSPYQQTIGYTDYKDISNHREMILDYE